MSTHRHERQEAREIKRGRGRPAKPRDDEPSDGLDYDDDGLRELLGEAWRYQERGEE